MREEFIHVAGIVGSLRRDSYNRWLLRAAQREAPPTLRIAELGLEGIPLYNPDGASPPPPAVQQLKTALYAADAVIIATPEYNHSIPGVLKNALDWLSVPPEENPLEGKPVAIIGATTGNFGTLRAQLHLRQVLSYFNADVLNRPEVLVARAKEKFGPDGTLQDELTRALLRQLLQELALRVWRRRSLSALEQH
jgi:chromate reductase